jgi:malate/lactate dehydrogenase
MKVAIAGGAGGVGSSLAFNLLLRPEPFDVAVIDRRPQKVLSHVMDLEQVLGLGGGRSIRAGDHDDLARADVVVVCASVPLTENTTRDVYLAGNAEIVAAIEERLQDWDGVLIMVTNPVDALCTRMTRLDRRRVLGYTLNDSLRLRTAIAAARGVEASAVEAWVLGEHGDRSVPIFSRVAIAGQPARLTPDERAAALEFVRTWYRRHVALDARRSSTWTSGAGVAQMVAALAGGGEWVASIKLEGEYGIEGVSLGVPVTLGPGGVAAIHEWELEDEELAALHEAADVIRRAARRPPAGPPAGR